MSRRPRRRADPGGAQAQGACQLEQTGAAPRKPAAPAPPRGHVAAAEAAGAAAIAEAAKAIGYGAVKYMDMRQDRVKNYVFSYERMLSLEGETAVYLSYAHARICSSQRKAAAAAGHADAGTAGALDAFMRAADALDYDEAPDYDALDVANKIGII